MLSRLQSRLQDLYEIDNDLDIGDYLITNTDLAGLLDTGGSNRQAREKLFVFQNQGELNLSLYLHDDVVKSLEKQDPQKRLDQDNLQDFCLALEGTSHFVYLTWNARHDRPVTMLEMELQAEVDKFVMISEYMRRQTAGLEPGVLRRLLFESPSYHDDLNPEESRRYREANSFAERYCRSLDQGYIQGRNNTGLLRELRRFYRFRKSAKLAYISRYH